MVVEKIDKEKITVSLSGAVGKKGLDIIKNCMEEIELNGAPKKVPQRAINEISHEINKSAWKKLKKKRNMATT
jgi:hypothetical protein